MAGTSPPHSQPRVMRLQALKAPPPRIWPGLRAGRQFGQAGCGEVGVVGLSGEEAASTESTDDGAASLSASHFRPGRTCWQWGPGLGTLT